jgi:ligand-binding SRPBCC domain-containing protein
MLAWDDRTMASTFTVVTTSPHPAQRLFDLSLSIDEHLESLAGSGERAIGGVTSGRIGLGETVTWRARHVGIWFTMTVRITEYDEPRRFVDEQVSGPFRLFRHVHEYGEPAERGVGGGAGSHGTTVMTDTITVASPVFGRLAERWVLVPYLRRLIRTRNRHLLAVLDATA